MHMGAEPAFRIRTRFTFFALAVSLLGQSSYDLSTEPAMKTKSIIRHSLAAAAVALASGQLHAAAFQNGSFELGSTGDEQSTVPAGWNGQVEYFTAATYGLTAADGNKLVDLAWYTSNPSSGNLSQTFDTTAGQVYRVDFQIGGSNYAGRGAPSSVAVAAVGDYLGNLFNVAANPNVAINWTPQSFTFTAGAATFSTLAFSSTVDSFSAFAFLDAVSVSAVPEPGALAMLLAGLGVVGYMAKRRQIA